MSTVAEVTYEVVTLPGGLYGITRNGVAVLSKRFGDEHLFTTRAGARKMITRLRRNNLSA